MPAVSDLVAFAAYVLLTWALPIAFLGFVVYALVRYFTRPSTRPPAAPADPMTILRERYARGEIDDEEFTRRKEHLSR